MRRATLVLLGVASSGCGLDPLEAPAGYGLASDAVVASGDYEVRVSATTLEMTLSRRGETLLTFPRDGLQLGRVDAIDDAFNYDPYPWATDVPLAFEPPGLEWRSVVDAELITADATTFQLTLTHEGGSKSVLGVQVGEAPAGAAPTSAGGRFRAALTPSAEGDAVALVRLRPRVSSEEGFYGLGELFDSVEHRGRLRAMQLEADGSLESANNEAHVPVPFLIGTRGWGVFVESPYPGMFDVATQADDLVEITFAPGAQTTQGVPFHLFGAEHPLDVTRHYYDVTGYPKLPARWALGPWIWRDETTGQEEVENDLATIRDLDLATTGYWIDRPYATAVNTFDFNPEQFTDADAMIATAHGLGFEMALWHTPYLDTEHEATADLRAEATANGYYPPEIGILLNGWGPPIDLTNPEAFAWWQSLVRTYTDQGIRGFKLDYGEDVVPGFLGARNVWKFADGSDERTMHAGFPLLYHRLYSELLPADGGFLLCRAGTYGDQVHGVIIWPGDLDADFSEHGEVVETDEGSYGAVGGLPASVIAGLSLGPSGFPFYGSDTGGYRHSPPDKETFVRWFQQTALSTVMQVGTSTNDVPWELHGENGFDELSLSWYRRYARLHLRLWPYVWTYAQRLAVDGRPIQRALGLAYPELGAHPNDLYLLGDHLLVAPVVHRGLREREVIFPEGEWVEYGSGTAYEGPSKAVVPAPLDTLPLFQRAGSIVVMLRPTIDTMSPTTEPHRVDSYATTPGILYARIVPGPDSTFIVFDGAEITQSATASGMRISVKGGAEFAFGEILEIVAFGAPPAEVRLDDNPLSAVSEASGGVESAASGYSFDDAAGGTLRIRVPPGEHEVDIVR